MTKKFRLQGLGCANCAAKMENAIKKVKGVSNVTINFMTTKMVIDGDEDKMPAIMKEAESIVKKFEPNTKIKKA
jgi:copper chaperone CopZ